MPGSSAHPLQDQSVISNCPGNELPSLPSGASPDTIADNPTASRKSTYNQSLETIQHSDGRDSVDVFEWNRKIRISSRR
jgi:hypothetical protein